MPGTRFPWAFAAALLIVIGFEGWVRTWPTDRRVAYVDDGDQTTAVRNQIESSAAPDVALVGSSMTYQGIATPELEDALSIQVGHDISVRNFAIRGGRVDLFEATIRALLRQKAKPRVIVVGISMRDLREHGLDLDRLSQLWTFADWRRESKHQWLGNQLPQVIHNEVGNVWWTLRDRTAIALRFEQLFLHLPSEPMPSRGERPSQHEGNKRDQTLADAIDDFNKPTNKRRMIQAYRPELGAKPPTVMSDRVPMLIEDCRRAGVKLIIVDLPLSEPLRSLIDNAQKKTRGHDASKDFDPTYLALVSTAAQRGGVPFAQSDQLGVDWTDEDFFDGQHLNYNGAVKLSNALAPMIASELKKKEPPRPEKVP